MSACAAFKTGWCRKSVQYSSGNGSNPQMANSRSRIRDSISVQMSVALMLVYLLFGAIGGDLLMLHLGIPTVTRLCILGGGCLLFGAEQLPRDAGLGLDAFLIALPPPEHSSLGWKSAFCPYIRYGS